MKRKLTYLLGLLLTTSAVWAEDCPVQAELLGNGGYMQVNPTKDFRVTMRVDTLWSLLDPPYSEKPAPNVDVYEVFAGQHNANVIAKFTYIPTIENPYLVCWYAKKRGTTGDVISCSLYAMDPQGDTLKICGAPSYYESASEYTAFGWQFTKMDLSAYIGQEISVYAQTTSCPQGGVCTFYWFLAFQCYGDNPEDVDMTRYLCSRGETITLQAPISDKYEWHMNTPSGPIVGTNRELVIADPAMITNYYCPVKDFCGETKLYSAIVQDVHAVFNYDLHCGEVNDTVFLTNKSFRQKRVSPYTKEPVDAIFWDFGNGTTSTAQQPGYVVYPKGQEVTIQLHAGTENFDCDAWKTVTFRTCDREDSIPLNPLPLVPVTDSIDSVVCHGTIVEWRDMYLTETGIYRDTLISKTWGTDSIYYVLNLTVLAEPVTIPLKDTASCQLVPFLWRGHQITSDTTCYDTIRTTKLGCDSIYASLRFVVKEPTASDTSAYVCYEDLPFIWHGKEAKDGDTIIRKNVAGCDSIVTLRLTTSSKPIVWNIDTTICDTLLPYKWREYTFTAIYTYRDTIYNARGCDSIYRSFTLDTIHCVRPEPPVPPEPPVDTCVSNLVYRKWVDFIFCDNGRDEFVAFQWYRNNLSLAGETGQYLYLPGTMGAAEYFVEATKTDGTKIRTCPLIFDNTPRSRDTYVKVPTVIRRGQPLQIAMSDPEADIAIYTLVGQPVLSAHILGPETSLPIPLPSGTYVLRLIGANINTTTKILIE